MVLTMKIYDTVIYIHYSLRTFCSSSDIFLHWKWNIRVVGEIFCKINHRIVPIVNSSMFWNLSESLKKSIILVGLANMDIRNLCL